MASGRDANHTETVALDRELAERSRVVPIFYPVVFALIAWVSGLPERDAALFGGMLGALVVVALARVALAWSQPVFEQRRPEVWRWLFGTAIVVSGILWGGLCALPILNLNQSREALYMALTLPGIMALSVVSFGMVPGVARAFAVAIVTPTIVCGLVVLTPLGIGLAAGMMGYLAFTLVFIKREAWLYQDKYKMERRAASERDRLEGLLNGFPGFVSCFDSELRYVAVNRTLSESLGLEPEDIIGKEAGFLGDGMAFSEALIEFRRSGARSLTKEVTLTVGGKPRWFLMVMNRVVEGAHDWVVVVSLDIWDKKIAEKRLDEQRALNLAASKMASVGEMAGAMAHEINNPLTIIDMSATLLEETLRDTYGAKASLMRHTLAVRDAVKHISHAIQVLRHVSKDSSDEPMQLVRVKDLLDHTLTLCRARFLASRVKLVVDEVPPTIAIECNGSDIVRVLLNLLYNAFDAIEHDDAPEVRLSVDDWGEFVSITCQDNGPGIPGEFHEQVTTPFFSTKPERESMGIGLHEASAAMQRHHGRLEIQSRPGLTRVGLVLPVRQSVSSVGPAAEGA